VREGTGGVERPPSTVRRRVQHRLRDVLLRFGCTRMLEPLVSLSARSRRARRHVDVRGVHLARP